MLNKNVIIIDLQHMRVIICKTNDNMTRLLQKSFKNLIIMY